MIEELKPCPFCGSDKCTINDRYPVPLWNVRCRNCGGKIPFKQSIKEAIAAWNRRPDDV